MKSSLAVDALNNAIAMRRAAGTEVAGCVLHTDRGSQFRSRKFVHTINRHQGGLTETVTYPCSRPNYTWRNTTKPGKLRSLRHNKTRFL
ncbi:hypothetical protein ODZ83_11145, partial [Acaricomes phytoseiuli]|nr:hypothetical protein [Acaricomes phytoseiuli]